MDHEAREVRGRGAAHNPANRFELLRYEPDDDTDPDGPAPTTRFFRDSTRTALAHNNSPDVGFDTSLNRTAVASTVAFTVTPAPRTNTSASRRGWTSRRASS